MIAEIRNSRGERLDHTFTPGHGEPRDVVVVGHGVTSHKDRPWLVALCLALAESGIASLRFSFAGNGQSEGRFEDATISKEVDDLGAVLDALDGWHIAYAGHSMGAAVGVLRAARDDRIRALVSMAGMVHVGAYMDRILGGLVPGRDVMLNKAHCPLSQGFLDDAHRVGSVVEPGKQVHVPWLLVHGTADDIVPLQDSLDMAAAVGVGADLVQLDRVDHRFTGYHNELVAAVVPWLQRHFR